jgi:hypothetical protein
MKWHLSVAINHKAHFQKILHRDKMLLIGSCFSEHLSKKLIGLKFQVVSNPFGILYNPKSIEKAISHIIDAKEYSTQELCFEEDVYFSFDHHTQFNNASAAKILEQINQNIHQAHQQLKNAKCLFITFGSAFYYQLNATHQVVGNCHKLADNQFSLYRDNAVEIKIRYQQLFKKIAALNPSIQIILTVSPVRHWKHGAADNNWSKAILIDAVRQLTEENAFVHYFPSYEIMMDELRDYRFYEEDLLHPNQQAVDFIWQRFLESSIAKENYQLLEDISAINNAVLHRPLNAQSKQHQQFIEKMLSKMDNLAKQHDYLDFSRERQILRTHN